MKDLSALSSLPSLSSLYCFASAAKHLSFTEAADELHITQSAVSHRIRKLEGELGFKLFQRFTRRLALTEDGRRLFMVLRSALVDIDNEISNIRSQELDGTLNITAPPSFMGCWLLPRLPLFHAECPSVQITIKTRLDLVDFRTEAIDIAIYYGDGIYPGLSVTPLMQEMLTPVCTKEYADAHNLWDNPEGLRNCLLLHDGTAWPKAQYFSEWEEWATHAGVTGLNFDNSYTFDRSDLAVNAAIGGTGVAIGRKMLVQRRMDSGELVAPFGITCTSCQSYYIATTRDQQETSRVAAFREWLIRQVEPQGDATTATAKASDGANTGESHADSTAQRGEAQ